MWPHGSVCAWMKVRPGSLLTFGDGQMKPEDWTPARGWLIAMSNTLWRGAIGSGVLGAAVYFAWPLAPYMRSSWAMIVLVLIISGVLGYPIGCCVARKLEDRSGLVGSTLFIPVVIVLIALQLAAGAVVVYLRSGQEDLAIFLFRMGAIIWSAIAAFKALVVGWVQA